MPFNLDKDVVAESQILSTKLICPKPDWDKVVEQHFRVEKLTSAKTLAHVSF